MKTVLYLGPEGTHSHEAALTLGQNDIVYVPCRSFREIFARLGAPDTTAVVPFENSTEGPITQVLDLLGRNADIAILRGLALKIRHHLLARPETHLADIHRVYSHPQALAQCAFTLQKVLPDAEVIETVSTAAAAQMAADDPAAAALASGTAGQLHGLATLRADMQDSAENTTRFLEIERITAGAIATPPAATEPPRCGRALFHIVLRNEPGALLKALQPFHTVGVNLTFIQSRPLADRPFQYGFFIEALANADLCDTLQKLLNHFADTRIIGIY